MGKAAKRRKKRQHLPKVSGEGSGIADGQSWFGGGYYGAKPWGSGRPSSAIRPPWLIVFGFTAVLVAIVWSAQHFLG
ncbi:MAG: hypothetical protein ACXVFI_19230 [Solirubrobacteraceae bacterium]